MGLTSLEDTLKAQLKVRKNAHVMLVDGMSKLTTHQVNMCQSSVFHIGGLKWKLIVYPAGKDGKKDYLSFYVRVKDKKSLPNQWEVICQLKLILVSQTQPDSCHSLERWNVCYNAKNAIHGEENFMWHKDLSDIKKGFLVNDKAVFCVEVTNIQANFPTTVIARTMGTGERLKLIEVPRNNSRFTWKITQFSSFDGRYHLSYEFTVGQRRWSLLMYPKGHGDGGENSLSLFLNAGESVTSDGPKAKKLAVYKLRVLDQVHRKHKELVYKRWFPSYNPNKPLQASWGWSKFLPLEKLKDPSTGFLVNDMVYIGVEFLLVSTTEIL